MRAGTLQPPDSLARRRSISAGDSSQQLAPTTSSSSTAPRKYVRGRRPRLAALTIAFAAAPAGTAANTYLLCGDTLPALLTRLVRRPAGAHDGFGDHWMGVQTPRGGGHSPSVDFLSARWIWTLPVRSSPSSSATTPVMGRTEIGFVQQIASASCCTVWPAIGVKMCIS